jgi:hypothetical protein
VQKKATRVEQRAYSNQAHTLVLCAADIRFACMKDFVHGIMATALMWSVFQERAPKKKKKKNRRGATPLFNAPTVAGQ